MTDSIYDIKVLHPLATDDSSLSGDSSIPSSPPTSSSIEEVTTIFVVGFPDDMQEREFQNMFMFAKGFEAASLKWHGGNDQQDFLLSNNNKKQMVTANYIIIIIGNVLKNKDIFRLVLQDLKLVKKLRLQLKR